MVNLKNKVALVTGATSGIGKAIAEELLLQGCRVILTGRDKSKIEKALLNRNEFKNQTTFIGADLQNDEDLNNLVNEVNVHFNRIDIIIHCAGIIHIGNTASTEVDVLDKLYAVNFRAPYFITKSFLPKIIKQKGQLVFINSTAGLDSWARVGQYAATKHALHAWVKSLRFELIGKGVKIINIFPGATDSPMQQYVQSVDKIDYDPKRFIPAHHLADIVVKALKVPDGTVVSDIVVKPLDYEPAKGI